MPRPRKRGCSAGAKVQRRGRQTGLHWASADGKTATASHATGTVEPEAALAMLEGLPDAGHKTVGADKDYDTPAFVASRRATKR
jgi:hypothetical protein